MFNKNLIKVLVALAVLFAVFSIASEDVYAYSCHCTATNKYTSQTISCNGNCPLCDNSQWDVSCNFNVPDNFCGPNQMVFCGASGPYCGGLNCGASCSGKSGGPFYANCNNPYWCEPEPVTTIPCVTCIPEPEQCTLDIYVWDQSHNDLNANIYVNGYFEQYNDHFQKQYEAGRYVVAAKKTGFYPDQKIVDCEPGEVQRVDLILNEFAGNAKLLITEIEMIGDKTCDETVTVRFWVKNSGSEMVQNARVLYNIGEDSELTTDSMTIQAGKTVPIDVQYRLPDDFKGLISVTGTPEDITGYYTEGRRSKKFYIDCGTCGDSCSTTVDCWDCHECHYCDDDYDIEVGLISLSSDYPDQCEIVLATAPITLEASDDLPDTVYVEAFVDGNDIVSETMHFERLTTKVFQFTIDTCKYSKGSHSVEVEATVMGVSDRSRKIMKVQPEDEIYAIGPDYCVLVDRIWLEDELKPGTTGRVHAQVENCGERSLTEVRARIEGFEVRYYDSVFGIIPGENRDVVFNVWVPEDATGTQTFTVSAWNNHVADSYTKEFPLYDGDPLVDMEDEFKITACELNQIQFDIINVGQITDTFEIEVSGPAAGWIDGVPSTVTLNPDQRATITGYVTVPCDAESGYYQFTVKAHGSPEYSKTAVLNVRQPVRMPSVSFGDSEWWLPLLLLMVLFLLLLALIALDTKQKAKKTKKTVRERRKFPMFDDCCV